MKSEKILSTIDRFHFCDISSNICKWKIMLNKWFFVKVMKINNFLAAALSFERPTLGIYRISSNSFTETILSWICKMNELQTVATNFNFLPTILNFCSGNYSRKELFKGQKYSWEYGSQRSSCFAMLMLLICCFQVQILFEFFCLIRILL